MNPHETFLEKVGDLCPIVDRSDLALVDIGVPVSFEGQGHPGASGFEGSTMNDARIVRNYITDGTIRLLADALDVRLRVCF